MSEYCKSCEEFLAALYTFLYTYFLFVVLYVCIIYVW